MPLSNKEICALLFTSTDNGSFACTTCGNIYKSLNGYSNLVNHLRRAHPTYEDDARTAARSQNALQLHLVDERARDIYRWCDWVVMNRLPFSFVERPLSRRYARMGSICKETLMQYLEQLAAEVEERASATTRPGSSAFYDDLDCNDRRFVLLSFCTVEEEEDLSAQSLFDLIADTLSRYRKPWESVAFMVGDNYSVNQYIGTRIGAIPLIGCASHRFNLAVGDFLAVDEPLLTKIQALMAKLRTIKGRALLRWVSKLAPLLRNATWWPSTYAMLKRYVRLEPAISSLGHGVLVEFDIQPLLLRRSENERARALLDDLENFEGVTKTLQRSNLTLSGVRRLFDHVVASYPTMERSLGVAAPIVNYPHLESGIVKLQRCETLSQAERAACEPFKQQNASEDDVEVRATFVVEAFKRRKVTKRASYMDVLFVPPTSNECERFFSCAKLVFSDLRKSMDIAVLESVMILLYNRDMWSVHTVERIRSRAQPRRRDSN